MTGPVPGDSDATARDPADDVAAEGGPADRYRWRLWQTPADSRRMQALVSLCWRADWPDVHLHAGDVDWWTVHALGSSPGLDERIGLWFDGEPDATELVGFAWVGLLGGADLVIAPDHRTISLIGPMAAWAEDVVARLVPVLDLPGVGHRIWTVETDDRVVGALTELGYARSGDPGYHHFVGRTDQLDLEPSDLPAGYRLATIASDADIAARVVAGHSAFPHSTMTVEKYRFSRSTPHYRPELDTVIVAPDGSTAAFALGWIDPLTLAVQLEPVGVHTDHQRRGLGTAICRAALHAAQAAGGRQVLIAAEAKNPAANGLYASLGLGLSARIVPLGRLG